MSCSTESTPVYQLTTTAEPSEAGSVSPATAEVDEGKSIQVTANPNDNWVFEGWQGGHTGSENPATVTVQSDVEIAAVFVKREYPLTVETEGNGEVTEQVIQEKTTDYEHGTTVELTAEPDDNWEFVEWQGDLTGSDNPVTITIDEETSVVATFELLDDSDPQVKLTVDWEMLEGERSSNSKQRNMNAVSGVEITHFGARLVYVEENAVFMQSVERTGEDGQGLITMEVPPTDQAFLLVAAVNYDGSDEALLFGTMEEISLDYGTQYDWSVENIDWFAPEWTVIDSLADDYEEGVLTANKDDESFELIIHVTDPFYPLLENVASGINYDSTIIKMNGTGGIGSYDEETGLRDFRFVFDNPTVGESNREYYEGDFPRLDGGMFNLPSVRYVVDEKIEMEISWE
ncbi:MAG: hypothetical protein WEA58_07155 [Balneolaceae bacterium]